MTTFSQSDLATRVELTQEAVKSLQHYDRETGVFTYRNRFHAKLNGRVAGYRSKKGYVSLWLAGRSYQAQRVAWIYMTGAWPSEFVDHKDGDPSNNRWSNLRSATNSQNIMNAKKPRTNTSGFKGVSWNKWHKKWGASIKANGRKKYLGYFDRPEDAHAAYVRAAELFFSEFARAA